MTSLELYRAYVRERRTRLIPGYTLEVLPNLVRHTATNPADEGFVLFADLPKDRTTEIIQQQLTYFGQLNQGFEWKIYEHDQPVTLKAELESLGFEAGPEEAFLVYPLTQPFPKPVLAANTKLERVTEQRGIDDVVNVQWALWQWNADLLREQLARGIERNETVLYCAYQDERPVGTGWLDISPDLSFADLHGGGVLPGARGQGIFSALLAARLHEAKARGCAYLAVDAAPMSRPILLRKGFCHICMTYPMRRSAR